MTRRLTSCIKFILLVACLAGLALPALWFHPQAAQAQTSPELWADPVSLFRTSGFASSPLILDSQDGNLHAFWIENQVPDAFRASGFPEVIFHTQTADGVHWSEPVDILTAPSAQRIQGLSVVMDDERVVHVVFLDWQGSAVYYRSAPLDGIDTPSAWTEPRKLLAFRTASYGLKWNDGTLYLIYTALDAPFGLYLHQSSDGGATWSSPVRISNAEDESEMANAVSFALGADGTIHVAWDTVQSATGGPPSRIFYTQSSDGGHTWAEPTLLDNGEYGAPALVVTEDDAVAVTWNGRVSIGGRYFRWSPDGGDTWSDRTTITPGVGGLTGGTMAADSAGHLHFATASHLGGINGIAYALWDGAGWSPLVNISKTYTPVRTEEDRQGYEPYMVVAGGNRVHVVYLGLNHAEVFYVSARSGAPTIPVPTPRPTRVPTATAVAAPTETGIAGATATPSLNDGSGATESGLGRRNPTSPVLVGVLPVLAMLVVIVLARLRRSAR